MKTNLFEQLILWLYRNKMEFTIVTGIVYGHKMYKTNGYVFTDLEDTIMVTAENFNYEVTNYEDLVKLLKAIK